MRKICGRLGGAGLRDNDPIVVVIQSHCDLRRFFDVSKELGRRNQRPIWPRQIPVLQSYKLEKIDVTKRLNARSDVHEMPEILKRDRPVRIEKTQPELFDPINL